MNSSIQDVHNLSWKLALVLKGVASDDLLQSYQEERRGKALRTVKQATYNALHFQAIGEAVRVGEPELLARGKLSPEGQELLQDFVDLHTTNSILHVGYQLGTVYRSDAVLTDDSIAPQEEIVNYQESTATGVRLPHAWLVNTQGERISTRDLADSRFVILVQRHAPAWRKAALRSAVACQLKLRVQSICEGGDYQPLDGKFARVFEADADIALLIRPDGYVGARIDSSADATASLQKVLARLLGQSNQVETKAPATEFADNAA